MRKFAVKNQYVLLPVGGQYSLGLVVTGQPVNPAFNQNQTELGILVLKVSNKNNGKSPYHAHANMPEQV